MYYLIKLKVYVFLMFFVFNLILLYIMPVSKREYIEDSARLKYWLGILLL